MLRYFLASPNSYTMESGFTKEPENNIELYGGDLCLKLTNLRTNISDPLSALQNPSIVIQE